MYQNVNVIRAKAQNRKSDNKAIVVMTVAELSNPIIITKKQFNYWCPNLDIEDVAGLSGNVLFYTVGEKLVNGKEVSTENSIVKDFALITGAKGMQQIALTNASVKVMSTFAAPPKRTEETIDMDAEALKLKGQPINEWEDLLSHIASKQKRESVIQHAETLGYNTL